MLLLRNCSELLGAPLSASACLLRRPCTDVTTHGFRRRVGDIRDTSPSICNGHSGIAREEFPKPTILTSCCSVADRRYVSSAADTLSPSVADSYPPSLRLFVRRTVHIPGPHLGAGSDTRARHWSRISKRCRPPRPKTRRQPPGSRCRFTESISARVDG